MISPTPLMKINPKHTTILTAFCASAFALGGIARAADKAWSVTSNFGLWDYSSLNWNGSQAFASGDNAIFSSWNGTVELNSDNIDVDSLSVYSSNVTVLTGARTLNITGGITLNNSNLDISGVNVGSSIAGTVTIGENSALTVLNRVPAASTIQMTDSTSKVVFLGSPSGVKTYDFTDATGGGFASDYVHLEFQGSAASAFANLTGADHGGAINSANSVNITAAEGNVTFTNNAANMEGGAIWAAHDVAITSGKGNISFDSNTALSGSGGAISSMGGVTLESDGMITFTGNVATKGSGGAIAAVSDVNITAAGNVEFSGNKAEAERAPYGSAYGGAIYINGGSVNMTSGHDIRVKDNEAFSSGGAIWASYHVTIESSGDILFESNKVSGDSGGALNAFNGNVIVHSANGSIEFKGNESGRSNGAISAYEKAIIEAVGDGGRIAFTGNTANSNSGAIGSKSVEINSSGDIVFLDNKAGGLGGSINASGSINSGDKVSIISTNGKVSFGMSDSSVTAADQGGAIYTNSAKVTVDGAQGVEFKNLNAATDGGALRVYGAEIKSSGDIVFLDNTAGGNGGSIFSRTDTIVTSTGGNVLFGRTDSTAPAAVTGGAVYSLNGSVRIKAAQGLGFDQLKASESGGAIYTNSSAELETTQAGGKITFTDNNAGSDGGAIYASYDVKITSEDGILFDSNSIAGLSQGSNGGAIYAGRSVEISSAEAMVFDSNRATTGNGGAIYSGSGVNIKAGAVSSFTNNLAGGSGGAIYLEADVASSALALNAANGNITFRGNKQGVDFSDLLNPIGGTANSIYINDGSHAATLNLTAGGGSAIYFYDPIASYNGNTTTINVNGTSAATATEGEVVFSGKDFAAGSSEVKSEIIANTTVWGGSLVLEDNAEFGVKGEGTLLLKDGAVLLSRSTEDFSLSSLSAGTITMEGMSKISAENQSSLSLSGNMILAAGANAEFSSSDGSEISLGGFAGGSHVVKTGEGSLLLNEISTMTGNFSVESGDVLINKENSLQTAGTVSISKDAQIRNVNDGTAQGFKNLQMEAGSILDMSASDLTIAGGSVAGSLRNVSSLIKNGSAADILTLRGNGALDGISASSSGGIDVTAGTLELRDMIGTGSFNHTINLADDTVLDLSLGNTDSPNEWGLNITGTGTVIGSNDYVVINENNMGLQMAENVYVRVQADDPSSQITLNDNNAYKGTTQVESGILNVSKNSQLGDTSLNRQVILNGGGMNVSASFDTARHMELWQNGSVNAADGVTTNWGSITGNNGLTFTKTGAGELGFTEAFDYGHINVHEGVLTFRFADQSGGEIATGSIDSMNIESDGAVNINKGRVSFKTLTSDGAIDVSSGAWLAVEGGNGAGNAVVRGITGNGTVYNGQGSVFTVNGDVAADVVYNGTGSVFNAESVTVTTGINNSGAFTANSVIGDVENYGEAKIGSHTGDLVNKSGGVYHLDTLHGNLTNESGGTVKLASGGAHLTDGNFTNYGALDFVNLGLTKTVTGKLSGNGSYYMEVSTADSNPATNADRLHIQGGASGTHIFYVTNTTPGSDAVKTITDIVKIDGPLDSDFKWVDGNNGFDGGVLHYVLTEGTAASGFVLNAVANGYSDASRAAINTIGAMSMGWFSQLDSLSKRMGELKLGGERQNGEFDVWVRSYGSQVNASLGISGMGNFREYQYGSDIGGDWVFAPSNKKHMLALGAFVGYQGAQRRFHDRYGSKGETNSVYGGVYATYMHSDGWYSDLVLKGQGFDSNFDSYGTGEKGDFSNGGVGVSLEVGRCFSNQGGWFLEPSVQFAYLHVFSKDFTMENSNVPVHTTDSDIYRFQGMLRMGKLFDVNGMKLQPYAKVGFEAQFSSAGEVSMAGYKFRPNTDGVRFVTGAGIAWQTTRRGQVYFDYEASVGEKYDRPWAVNLGYRFTF
ncbi:outer membrane autotransporter barrel domain protein [Akkermansia sp. KLE1797]|nr:outer membrane autotransporter barrel domain protein [Akkermansia sp. KLE1797]KXU54208.1 outer membrane autotransporter barrel domain protein [Akkermansia sp. KLE1798]KZA04740.1 outer membrane autotransporter barrel domain protein [Akkermansia sp. KLE1605]